MSRNEGVCCQIPAVPDALEKVEEFFHCSRRRAQNAHMRLSDPLPDSPPHLLCCERIGTDVRVGHQPGECQHDDPRDSNRFIARKHPLPPFFCYGVKWRRAVVSENQQICVGNNHRQRLSASIWSNSWFMLIPRRAGFTPTGWGVMEIFLRAPPPRLNPRWMVSSTTARNGRRVLSESVLSSRKTASLMFNVVLIVAS